MISNLDVMSRIHGKMEEQQQQEAESEYINNKYRDIKERLRASKGITAMSVHQALHEEYSSNSSQITATTTTTTTTTSSSSLMTMATPAPSAERRKTVGSFQSRASFRLASFTEKSSSAVSLDDGSFLKNRYMNAKSTNLQNESWE
eukprot:CAMPEP_0118696390 /NCGR_PEP_ID=MMETSP0800-20121206/13815_1 /TAXON_ID=210618 ORGANISM="Striatella unipunctata, Strain CCMP2910" /NCGR_SAMPLE_ID=MMETSP0800 /ASSEMBLY_ACC=CAM_ASM_000638 /LENGTH=145 /DNA_ID=CAMNT_0006595487 /DNA_START=183 /DNA_END=620 /DNA_ORIENTATION=-